MKSNEGDSIENIDLISSTDDNESDVEMEIDVEMGPDVGEVLTRIYNDEAHVSNLRKGGQDSLVQYMLTDAAERDEFIQLVQNPTPGSKWDIYAHKTPPEKISTGWKTPKNSSKKPKKEEGCKPIKNAKKDDLEDHDGNSRNASHTKGHNFEEKVE